MGLIYGAYDDDLATPSHRTFGGGDHPLSTEEVRLFWNLYAPRERPWRARPLHGPLDRAPPAVVVVAERDVLRWPNTAGSRGWPTRAGGGPTSPPTPTRWKR